MFDNLQHKLTNSLKILQGKRKLSPKNISAAITDVRKSLLEADVALTVVQDFIQTLSNKALGLQVSKGLTPSQTFIKLVEQELISIISADNQALNLRTQAPAVIMVAGLQGTGKTTSIAKLALHLKRDYNKKVLLVSADVYRPAAIEQLQILAKQIEVDFFPSTTSDKPLNIISSAKKQAQAKFYDVLLIDTAGRLHLDEEMMSEISQLQQLAKPIETLFVVDSMSGQDAVNSAKVFVASLDLSGIILTKIDGDSRGGAALSVTAVTGKPIKFLGTGEKTNALEVFHPDRIVSRLLGMGDVLSLIEDIKHKIDHKQAQKTIKKIKKGGFDLNDMHAQLLQMRQMGGMEKMLDKLPMGWQIPQHLKNKIGDDKQNIYTIAIINAMTPKERQYINLIKGSRKRRIAQGSGTTVQQVNQTLKQYEKMKKMMGKLKAGKMQKVMKKMQQSNNLSDNLAADLNALKPPF